MIVVIAYYHCCRVAFAFPKRDFIRLVNDRRVMWLDFHNEWAILTSEKIICEWYNAYPISNH